MISGAVTETRTKFQECAHVTDPAEIDKLCDDAMDAAKFMRDMVVQAKLNERGNYAMQVEEEHLSKDGSVTAQAPEDVVKPGDC